jgi:addiction module HigA family antidote
VINGNAGISPEMALRIVTWLGGKIGGSESVWLALQAAYDLWQVRKAGLPKVKLSVITDWTLT